METLECNSPEMRETLGFSLKNVRYVKLENAG